MLTKLRALLYVLPTECIMSFAGTSRYMINESTFDPRPGHEIVLFFKTFSLWRPPASCSIATGNKDDGCADDLSPPSTD